ncbi:hypothetical protein [Moritella viscosa]|uniref:Lipoprotein n=1 Tax=Moritella viscosa TaxID=80854 RepID=A0ABY1HJQ6_9GAMM|nr:hypothetical protein [Moritella viscosa]SGY98788.1 Putative uncharacterized protein [Moritella viscosa]SGZ13136.1 Putative uncharacterized protein [Moritella viscosa]SHO27806.1 Putative uncharacterized protein [Moritella viscosa]
MIKIKFNQKVNISILSLILSCTASAQSQDIHSAPSKGEHFWNQELTKLMRESHSGTFSNWSNDSSIDIGALGYIDHITGEFTLINTDLVNNSEYFQSKGFSKNVNFSSKDTSHQAVKVEVDGNYRDPQTGLKVAAAIQSTWDFKSENSLAASYVMSKQSYTNNPYELVKNNWEVIKDAANKTSYSEESKTGITQGFGIITGVKWASRGVTIASTGKDGSFGMTTSLDFFSPKNDKVGIKASILKENSSKNVTAISFPNEDQNTDLVPVSFTFTSIDGTKPIVNWTKPIHQLELLIDSQPGATYKTYWSVSYTLSDGSSERETSYFSAPGSAAVYLPHDATDVQLSIELPGVYTSNKCVKEWHDPINQWADGKKVVHTNGVWPNNGWCDEL